MGSDYNADRVLGHNTGSNPQREWHPRESRLPECFERPEGSVDTNVNTTRLLGTDVRFGREESKKFIGSLPAFSVEDATERNSGGGSPD
jgi:hypothetical protein